MPGIPIEASEGIPWRLYRDAGTTWVWTVKASGYQGLQILLGIILVLFGLALSQIIERGLMYLPDRSNPIAAQTATTTSDDNTGSAEPETTSHEPTETDALLDQDQSDLEANQADHVRPRFNVPKSISFFIAIGLAIIQAYFGFLDGPQVALSNAKECGVYGLVWNASRAGQAEDDLVQDQKERRAGSYMHDCYSQRLRTWPGYEADTSDPDRCKFFESKELQYSTRLKVACPFRDSSVCRDPYRNVEFRTEELNARVLGINSATKSSVVRRTVCAPLSIDAPFVRGTENPFHFQYFFGKTLDINDTYFNYTYDQTANPFNWGVATYGVSVLSSSHWQQRDWIPIDALDRFDWGCAPEYSQLTIMFFETGRIYYTGRSDDPIFGGDQELCDQTESPLFCNTDHRARPLACVDWHELRDSYGTCTDLGYASDHNETENEILRHALRKSNIHEALKFRLGSALLAQERLTDVVSQPLMDDQWALEAQALFETSLARLQYDVLDIAIGDGHEKGDYINESQPWARGKMCKLYRYQLPVGHFSVSVSATAVLTFLLFLGSAMALPYPQRHQDPQKRELFGRHLQVGEKLVIGSKHLYDRRIRIWWSFKQAFNSLVSWMAWIICCGSRSHHESTPARPTAASQPQQPTSSTSVDGTESDATTSLSIQLQPPIPTTPTINHDSLNIQASSGVQNTHSDATDVQTSNGAGGILTGDSTRQTSDEDAFSIGSSDDPQNP